MGLLKSKVGKRKDLRRLKEVEIVRGKGCKRKRLKLKELIEMSLGS